LNVTIASERKSDEGDDAEKRNVIGSAARAGRTIDSDKAPPNKPILDRRLYVLSPVDVMRAS
jgi:hypothetical protein